MNTIIALKYDSAGMHRIADLYDQESSDYTKEEKVYIIPAHNIRLLDAKLAKLNNVIKNIRIKHPEAQISDISYKILEEIEISHQTDLFTKLPGVKAYKVKVDGKPPQIAGYEFIASIQHSVTDDQTYANLVVAAPGQEYNDKRYRTMPPKCDHCGVNRGRRDTYILKNVKTNQEIQVGSSCLKEFLGYFSNPHHIANLLENVAQLFTDASEAGFDDALMGKRGRRGIRTAEALIVLDYLIEKYGYYPSNANTSTKTLLYQVFFPVFSLKGENPVQYILDGLKSLSEGDVLRHKNHGIEALKFIGQFTKKANPSDFEWNMGVTASEALAQGEVDLRKLGFFAYSIPAYNKATSPEELEKQKKREEDRANKTPSLSNEEIQRMYTPGTKLSGNEMKITNASYQSGDYGGYNRLFMIDNQNKVKFQWNSTAKTAENLKEGDILKIKSATVKNFYISRMNNDVVIVLKNVTTNN